jgi:hypothetical protein
MSPEKPAGSESVSRASRLRRHVRSNAVAYLALFVALGGTSAWAADKITSKDIAKNAVRAKHLKKNSVKTAKIANRAVTADKLADGVEGLQGEQGVQGPEGPRGPSDAVSGKRAGAVPVGDVATPVADLALGEGTFVIFATGYAENQTNGVNTRLDCILSAGATADELTMRLAAADGVSFRGTLALHIAHNFDAAGEASLDCTAGSTTTVNLINVRLTAIQVDSLTPATITP